MYRGPQVNELLCASELGLRVLFRMRGPMAIVCTQFEKLGEKVVGFVVWVFGVWDFRRLKRVFRV